MSKYLISSYVLGCGRCCKTTRNHEDYPAWFRRYSCRLFHSELCNCCGNLGAVVAPPPPIVTSLETDTLHYGINSTHKAPPSK